MGVTRRPGVTSIPPLRPQGQRRILPACSHTGREEAWRASPRLAPAVEQASGLRFGLGGLQGTATAACVHPRVSRPMLGELPRPGHCERCRQHPPCSPAHKVTCREIPTPGTGESARGGQTGGCRGPGGGGGGSGHRMGAWPPPQGTESLEPDGDEGHKHDPAECTHGAEPRPSQCPPLRDGTSLRPKAEKLRDREAPQPSSARTARREGGLEEYRPPRSRTPVCKAAGGAGQQQGPAV